MRSSLLLCSVLALCAFSKARAATESPAPLTERTPVLLISIDGLRPVDITQADMPTLSALAHDGVQAAGMRPSYPSLTFPNHYTLVTGLRPDNHGIVHNSMEDAELGIFRLSIREAVEEPRWWGGEPVWVSAERAGLATATMYWPGSEAPIAGIQPRQWYKFDHATSAYWRADTVADWLLRPVAERPAFATLYFDKVDHAAHQHGPNSAEAREARHETDRAIAHLFDRLKAANLFEQINIVLVSDHGFAEVPPGQTIAVEDMVEPEAARAASVGQVIHFTPQPGHEEEVRKRLIGRHAHYQCWEKDKLPADWHYGSHARIAPIVCQMDEGWDALPREAARERQAHPETRGSHGYDPQLPAMQASFIAHGPAFQSGRQLPVFDNVDVYPLLMQLLQLPAAAHQGNICTFASVLSKPHSDPEHAPPCPLVR